MQQRNSSSFCPPVAREKSLRDCTIYLKIYSCALKRKVLKVSLKGNREYLTMTWHKNHGTTLDF